MHPTTMRRMTSEHRSLHAAPLPPNYLHQTSSASDDITQLDVLLAGPPGTPYARGVWRLHLKMPEDYPRSPPKASFRTRIWHPNVEENTGAICVDTLKRDRKQELTIRDILTTISCLLIYPNPDSALNASAGQLLQEDYENFARHAELMTSIHAPISKELRARVEEATRRGEDILATRTPKHHQPSGMAALKPKTEALSIIRRATVEVPPTRQSDQPRPYYAHDDGESESEDDENDEASASKENDPSYSPLPIPAYAARPPSPRKNVLGKRPLSALPVPIDPDSGDDQDEDMINNAIRLSSSERNIANNTTSPSGSSAALSSSSSSSSVSSGSRKSLKLGGGAKGISSTGRGRDDGAEPVHRANEVMGMPSGPSSTHSSISPNEDLTKQPNHPSKPSDGKENVVETTPDATTPEILVRKHIVPIGFAARNPSTSRSISTSSAGSGMSGSGRSNNKPRVGLRRL